MAAPFCPSNTPGRVMLCDAADKPALPHNKVEGLIGCFNKDTFFINIKLISTQKHNQKYKSAIIYEPGIMVGLASITLAP